MTDSEQADRPLVDWDRFKEHLRSYQEVRAVFTAVELDLFTPLAGRCLGAADVARARGTDERATEVLLDALVALGLVDWSPEGYRAGELARRHLVHDAPDPRVNTVLHHAELWRRWSSLTEVVRTGQPAPKDEAPHARRRWLRSMHDAKRARDPEALFPFSLEGVRRAVDLGGGAGTLSVALARACPAARIVLLDRESTRPVARERIPASLWGDRIRFQAGDLLEMPSYGRDFDLAILSAVLHAYPAPVAARLVERAAACLRPGGRLLVRERILQADHAGPRSAALFSLNMVVVTPGGRVWTAERIQGWMREAGLHGIERHPAEKGEALVGIRSPPGIEGAQG